MSCSSLSKIATARTMYVCIYICMPQAELILSRLTQVGSVTRNVACSGMDVTIMVPLPC